MSKSQLLSAGWVRKKKSPYLKYTYWTHYYTKGKNYRYHEAMRVLKNYGVDEQGFMGDV